MTKPKKEDKLKRAQEILSKVFGEEAIAAIPEDQREAKLEELAEYVMRQDEFNRSMNATQSELEELRKHRDTYIKAQSWYENLKDWHNEQQKENANLRAKVVTLEERLQSGGGDDLDDDSDASTTRRPKPPTPPAPAALPANVVTKDVLQQALNQGVGQAASFMASLNKLSNKHRKEFADDLDWDELVKFSTEQSLDPWTSGYDAYVAEAREQAREAEVEKKVKDAEKRGREAARAEMQAAALPHLSGPSSGFGGTLSGLSKDHKKGGVDGAVRSLLKMRSEGGAPPTV